MSEDALLRYGVRTYSASELWPASAAPQKNFAVQLCGKYNVLIATRRNSDGQPLGLGLHGIHRPSTLSRRMDEAVAKYRRLDSGQIVETVEALHARIADRFPGCGLGKLVAELLAVARETITRAHWIQKPHLPLRSGAAVLSLAIVALLIAMLVNIRHFQFEEYTNFIQALEASISSVVFIGAAILFLLSWENRIKRQRALKALHELRAMAHIVDMHQLTKDPESYVGGSETPASPQRREMTPFELNRYLDYCSETLALISKIAALYVQGFQDPVLLDAVDDVENLTSGFSRKIWQKLTILENLGRTPSSRSSRVAGASPPTSESVASGTSLV